MSWFEIWNSITEFMKWLAPIIITAAVFYIGVFFLKGSMKVVEMIRFVFEKESRVFFIVILFIVVWYFWDNFQNSLGW